MTQTDAFVGIDISKHELVCHLLPAQESWRVANDAAGHAALLRRLRAIARRHALRIGFEASGGYERKLAILLERKGLAAYMLDPARVRSFARASGRMAKTDPLDAALIARALEALHPDLRVWQQDEQARKLAEHVRIRDLARVQAGQLANQLETLDAPMLRRSIVAHIARIKAMILRIEKEMASIIAASTDLARRDTMLRSAPGIGPILAATLLAHLPELGRLSSRQIASLAGVAPFDRQSGTSRKAARCSGGRPAVRRALYLAALSIMRTGSSPLAELGKRLVAQGKPKKLALIATARKLLVTLNAMLKYDQPYAPA